jgi:hypothetical protein
MKSIQWAVLVMAFTSGACAPSSLETTPLNAPPRALAARPPSSVEVFSSTPPTRAHVDVALITATESNLEGNTSRTVQRLLERAAQLGCDALYISSATSRAGNSDVFDPGSHGLLGTCVAYTGRAPAPASVANAVLLTQPAPPPEKPIVIVDNGPSGARH